MEKDRYTENYGHSRYSIGVLKEYQSQDSLDSSNSGSNSSNLNYVLEDYSYGEPVSKKNLRLVLPSFPNGCIMQVSSKDARLAFDCFKILMQKQKLVPVENYEIQDKHGAEVPMKITESNTETIYELASRLSETKGTIVISKKRGLSTSSPSLNSSNGLRRNGNVTPRKPQSSSNLVIVSEPLSSTPNLTHGTSESLVSPAADSSIQTSVSPATSTSRLRRLSIPNVSGFFFGRRSRSNTASNLELATADVPIFSLTPNEQRQLTSTYVPDALSKAFVNIDNHGLSFGKLSTRKRFLSWSRNSQANLKPNEISLPIFGQKLEQHMPCDVDGTLKLPPFFENCIDYLEKNALQTPGIFRVSGVSGRVKALKDDVDAGIDIDFNGVVAHDITSLIKLYLREMPEPLLTFKLYDYYIAAAKYLHGTDLDNVIRLLTLCLPSSHLYLLQALLKLLQKVAANSSIETPITSPTSSLYEATLGSDIMSIGSSVGTDNTRASTGNLMTASNLAIVIAPNILRPKDMSKPEKAYVEHEYVMKTFERILALGDLLFQVDKDVMNSIRFSVQ